MRCVQRYKMASPPVIYFYFVFILSLRKRNFVWPLPIIFSRVYMYCTSLENPVLIYPKVGFSFNLYTVLFCYLS